MAEPLFINPFTDFGFKKIFGEEQNKDLLIDFLNELLAAQNQHISNLVFKKNDRLGSDDLDRKVVFDLYCENDQGEKFTVELQKAKQSFFKVASYTALSKEEKAKYEDSLKYYNDLKNSLDTAQEDGYQEGYQEAQTIYEAKLDVEKQRVAQEKQRAEHEKQRAEHEKQRAEQLYQDKLQTLQRMRQAGLSDADICAFLNISTEELEGMTNLSSGE